MGVLNWYIICVYKYERIIFIVYKVNKDIWILKRTFWTVINGACIMRTKVHPYKQLKPLDCFVHIQCARQWTCHDLVTLGFDAIPDSNVHGASMGPIWGRQDPGGPHVGAMNFAIWDVNYFYPLCIISSCYNRRSLMPCDDIVGHLKS